MQRLRKRQDFLAARSGRRASGKLLTLQSRDRGDETEARAGFTVTKKEGGAVERNRIRRRLREALGRVAAHARHGHDYVWIGRREALAASFQTIVDDMTAAFGRVHQNRRNGEARRERAPGDAST